MESINTGHVFRLWWDIERDDSTVLLVSEKRQFQWEKDCTQHFWTSGKGPWCTKNLWGASAWGAVTEKGGWNVSSRKVRKPTKGEHRTKLTVKRTETNKAHNFKELDRDLLVIDETEKIGSGTFGRCFTAIYRNQYQVIVKEIKVKDSSKRKIKRAKQEVLNEASVLADLGYHPGIPIYSVYVPYQRLFIWFSKTWRLRAAVLPSRRLQQQALLRMLPSAPKFWDRSVKCCCLCTREDTCTTT